MASLPQLDTSLLREENVALRQILGYHTGDIESFQFNVPDIGEDLEGVTMKDVMFLSIDTDTRGSKEELVSDQLFHIGVFLLDTQYLLDCPDPNSSITSYQYMNSKLAPMKLRRKKRFLWGETEFLSLPEISLRIKGFT